jgi:hypothetical protein
MSNRNIKSFSIQHPPRKNVAPAAFKDSLRTVPLSDNEFHSIADHPFYIKAKRKVRLGAFQTCVNVAVANVISQIKGRKCYDPMFLTDSAMNLDKFGEAVKEDFLDSQKRSEFQRDFCKKLSEGENKLVFHIYGQVNSGNDPDCIFMWRVSFIHGENYAGSVAKAIV